MADSGPDESSEQVFIVHHHHPHHHHHHHHHCHRCHHCHHHHHHHYHHHCHHRRRQNHNPLMQTKIYISVQFLFLQFNWIIICFSGHEHSDKLCHIWAARRRHSYIEFIICQRYQTVATKTRFIIYRASIFHIIEAAMGDKILYQSCIRRSYISELYIKIIYQRYLSRSEIFIMIRDIKPLAKNTLLCTCTRHYQL